MSRVERAGSAKQPAPPKVRFLHLLTLATIFGLLFCFAILVKAVYLEQSTSGFVRAAAHVIPFPVAKVDGRWIFYSNVIDLADALPESEAEMSFSDVLQLQIRREEREALASEFGIDGDSLLKTVDHAAMDQEFLSAGWSRGRYEEVVLRPFLIEQALETAIQESDSYQAPARDRIQRILDDVNYGISFTDLAIQSSEGGAAPAGGDIGYVTKDDLQDGLEPLFDVPVDEVSGIMEGPTFFSIGFVYDAIEVAGERVQVGAQLITINKVTLKEAMDAYAANQVVQIYLH